MSMKSSSFSVTIRWSNNNSRQCHQGLLGSSTMLACWHEPKCAFNLTAKKRLVTPPQLREVCCITDQMLWNLCEPLLILVSCTELLAGAQFLRVHTGAAEKKKKNQGLNLWRTYMCAVPLLLERRIQEKSGMSTSRTTQSAGFNSTTLGKHWPLWDAQAVR